MSIVSSENLACSHADPTIRISCRLSVICGDRSQGGVVNGLSLEPEPLNTIKLARFLGTGLGLIYVNQARLG